MLRRSRTRSVKCRRAVSSTLNAVTPSGIMKSRKPVEPSKYRFAAIP